MPTIDYEIKLSLEELAVVMSLLNRPDLAKSLLTGNFGEISLDEERGRLLAANHTLLAKNALFIENEQPVLNNSISEVVGAMINQKFVLRISRSVAGIEQILTYFFVKNFFVEHQIYQAVVHQFKKAHDEKVIYEMGKTFLELTDTEEFDCPEFELTQESLDEIRELAVNSINNARTLLLQNGVPENISRLLVEDLQYGQRGTVMRIEKSPDGMPIANRGFLVLRGIDNRAWLFNIINRENQGYLKAVSFSDRIFEQTIKGLF